MRTNLTCDACRSELTALLDGALHPSVARALEDHLETCAACAALRHDYAMIADYARRLPSIEAPAWLEGRVVRAVAWPARIKTLARRAGAAAMAASFAVTVGLVALAPRLLGSLGLAGPGSLIAGGINGLLDVLVGIPKRLATDLAFYEPLARQVLLAFHALAAIPRALVVALQTPEAQLTGIVLLTLGVALYVVLRPSRSPRGVGHACLAL